MTVSLPWFRHPVVTVAEQPPIDTVRVMGSPDISSRFAPRRIRNGSSAEPLSLKLCRRPPLIPSALTLASFGFSKLTSSWVSLE